VAEDLDDSNALFANESLEEPGEEVVKGSSLGFSEPWLVLASWAILENPAITSQFTSASPTDIG